jgi:hypothetical protein
MMGVLCSVASDGLNGSIISDEREVDSQKGIARSNELHVIIWNISSFGGSVNVVFNLL